MNIEFSRHEPCFDKILLVLTLDKQKMKERILIGTELEIRFRLQGSKHTDLLCDVTRPLGTFLTKFEYDSQGTWNQFGIAPLQKALNSRAWNQPALEQASCDFLQQKFKDKDPVCQYTAFRIWNDYLIAREVRERKIACEQFVSDVGHLTIAFSNHDFLKLDNDTGKADRFHISSHFFGSVPKEDTRLDLWFPERRRDMECVTAYASFYPLIIYYLNRLNDWGLCFRKCKVCGKYFLAKSLRYELCSDKCRKKQSLQNKREFDKRAKENNYDLLYKNECQNWRNKINKAKKTAGFPTARLEEMQAAFEVFRKEALQRKKAVKDKTTSPKEFTDWLYQQSNIIVELAP